MSERSERMDDRATGREPGVEGVGGRSPLEGMSERSERMDDRATAREPGVDGVGGRSPLEGMSERSAPTERMDEHTTLTFVVPGVSCAHCQAAITDEVGEVDGVEQ